MTFSLLWPENPYIVESVNEATYIDLRLDVLVNALSSDHRSRRFTQSIVCQPLTDPIVIHYRQAILDNLLAEPALITHFEQMMPKLNQLAARDEVRLPIDRKQSALFDVIERVSELELFVECVQGFSTALLDESMISAEALHKLRAFVHKTAKDPAFQQLAQQLPQMRQQLRSVASIAIGVNLDHNLRPIAATLLEINEDPYTNGRLIDRLFGKNKLHGMPDFDMEALAQLTGKREATPMMVPLFADLAQVLDKVARPIAKLLKQYGRVNATTLVNLREELQYLCDAARLVQTLQAAGLPMTKPIILPADERKTILQDAYNVLLALDQLGKTDSAEITQNNVQLDDNGRIFILTGPNGGGKTTYLQAVGVAQLMAQVGLFVAASKAEIAPVDLLLTHFQSAENFERGTGRFGEEAQRLRDIFAVSTSKTMILLNESLASTSSGESFYLAQDVMRLFRKLGVRAIFATHLHELAARIDELNESDGTSRVISVVASPISDDPNERTYRVLPRPPLGHSYARELAAKHGISLDQLTNLLNQRGLLN